MLDSETATAEVQDMLKQLVSENKAAARETAPVLAARIGFPEF